MLGLELRVRLIVMFSVLVVGFENRVGVLNHFGLGFESPVGFLIIF